MKKTVALPALIMIVFMISGQVEAASRGIHVVAKSGEQLYLYKDYHALVIGVSDYTQGWPDLPNAVKDAREVESVLKDLGFNVKLVVNSTSRQLGAAINKMAFDTGFLKRRDRY